MRAEEFLIWFMTIIVCLLIGSCAGTCAYRDWKQALNYEVAR